MPHDHADERDHHPASKPTAEATRSGVSKSASEQPGDLSHLDRVWSKAGAGSQPQPAQKSAPQRAAAADELVFGDIEVNDHRTEKFFVFNLEGVAANTHVHLEGPPALQLVARPNRLRPSREGVDPERDAIEITYCPTVSAVDDGVLEVMLQWPHASETLRIPIRAAAHRRWESSHAEAAAERKQAREQAEEDERSNDAKAANEAEVSRLEKQGGSWDTRIDLAAKHLAVDVQGLFTLQQNGVDSAQDKAEQFVRRRAPAAQPSIVMQLVKQFAMIGLDLATAGIAISVSKKVESVLQLTAGAFNSEAKRAGTGFPTGIRAAFTEHVKDSLTKGGEAIKQGVASAPVGDAPSSGGASVSADSRIDYFRVQRDALSKSEDARAHHVVDVTRSLLPLNNARHADEAVRLLESLTSALKTQKEDASRTQEAESSKAWVRFLSHMSLGSVKSDQATSQHLAPMLDGSATAKIEAARNGSGDYDGLIELDFSAAFQRPQQDVKVTRARLNGVSQATARHLALKTSPLQSALLPVRAKSVANNDPLAVTIIRDEAGNVRYSDTSGAIGMPTPWLSRRGGALNGSDAAAHRGAKGLIDELVGKSADQLGVEMEYDHE